MENIMEHIIEYNIDLGQTKPDNVHRKENYCPFCDTEHLKNVLERRGKMIWLENKYPVLKNCWQTIIIETDKCDDDFSNYSPEQALMLVQFGLEKWNQLKSTHEFKSVVYYRNHGIMSGGTIRHPHSQIVGFKDYDYHDDITPDHLSGRSILAESGIEINVSTNPIIGFFEFNLILRDPEKLPEFVHYMQRTAYFLVHIFSRYTDSYNIFHYDFPGDDTLYVKMIPRFLTNPLYVGYMVSQISNSGHMEKVMNSLRRTLLSGKD
jgi:hypothetical protein